MPAAALRLARSALEVVAAAFLAAGLALSDRRNRTALGRGLAVACQDRGLALVH